MKCDTLYCTHKVIIVCEVLRRTIVIEAYDETYQYKYEVYIDNELCDEGANKLIYELAERGDYEKIIGLVCDD